MRGITAVGLLMVLVGIGIVLAGVSGAFNWEQNIGLDALGVGLLLLGVVVLVLPTLKVLPV